MTRHHEVTGLASMFICALISSASAWAQRSTALHFEVAAIKPAPDCVLGPNGGGKLGRILPGRIEVECATIFSLIGGAYAVDERLEHQWIKVEGGPGWLRSETYSVVAKSEDGKASAALMLGPMMRALIEERLALKTHGETREGPIYELAVAKGGLKAKASAPGACVPGDPNRPPQDLRPNSDTFKNCGIRNLRARGGMVLEATGVTMSELAKSLPLDHETIDHTGVEGRVDFVLRYSLEGASAPSAEPAVEAWPGIFTAIVEQIGLKLNPGRGPLHFLIIDSVQRPAQN
jgi:uncharacterized protein (TIGR03435 family)